MRFIKDYKTFILEAKEFKYEVKPIKHLVYQIEDDKKKDKVSKLLLKDIFTNYKLFVDDISFPQKNTNDKISILNNSEETVKITKYYKDDMYNITDYVSNADLKDISATNYKELIEDADSYHDSLNVTFLANREDEKDGDIFITYPNNWYWINLKISYSKEESENMGHCGRDEGKVLFSLRDDKKQSHITASYDPKNRTIYQIKGRKNSKPTRKYHQYILDMLCNTIYPIIDMSAETYRPDLNFEIKDLDQKLYDDLISKKKDLIYTDAYLNSLLKDKDYDGLIKLYEEGLDKIPSRLVFYIIFLDIVEESPIYEKFMKLLYQSNDLMKYSKHYTEKILNKGILSKEEVLSNIDLERLLYSDDNSYLNTNYYLSLGYKPSSKEVAESLKDRGYRSTLFDIFDALNLKADHSVAMSFINDDINSQYIFIFDWKDYIFDENSVEYLENNTFLIFLLSDKKTENINMIYQAANRDNFKAYLIRYKPSDLMGPSEFNRKVKNTNIEYTKEYGYLYFFNNEQLKGFCEKYEDNFSEVGLPAIYDLMYKRNLIDKDMIIRYIKNNDYIKLAGLAWTDYGTEQFKKIISHEECEKYYTDKTIEDTKNTINYTYGYES
jgi:hypothetical protein